MGFIYGANNALEIQGRRKVSNEKAATDLQEELEKKLTTIKESGKEAIISDMDLSQNHCPPEFFETVFSTLSSQNTPVQRLRLFGIPTMTDEAVIPLAEYLRTVPPEAAPFELHLSDCALTTVGFTTLIEAIEENSAFPCVDPKTQKKSPLYLRLENNYIEPSAMQEKVDAKVIKIFLKDKSVKKLQGEDVAKVSLVKKQDQVGFQQKDGMPPSPEEVAPIRSQVYDWRFLQNKQKQEAEKWMWVPDNSWQKPQWHSPQQSQWQKGQQSQWGQQAPWHKPQQSEWNQQKGKGIVQGNEKGKAAAPKAAPKAAPGKGIAQGTVPFATKTALPQPAGKGECKWCEKGECWSHGKGAAGGKGAKGSKAGKGVGAATAAPAMAEGGKNAKDRSRTPAPRAGKGGQPAQPLRPPPGVAKTLPEPWQEQFSEEFQIPYFWNPESLESSWEVPTA